MLNNANNLNEPLDHINAYPTLVEKKDMYGEKAVRQAEKVNNIISSMFDDFTVKTTQGKKTINNTYRASSYRSQLVDNVKDVCYNEYCTLSFDFYSSNITRGMVVPVLRLDNIKSILGDIMFTGIDSKTSPTSSLANYGFFTITYNDIADERQLSFVALTDVPEKIWYVSLMFIANERSE